MTRQAIIDLLTGINSEGELYYFTGYSSPEHFYKRAVKLGMDKDLARAMYEAALALVEAVDELHTAIDDVLAEYDISSEEIEY